jgi:dTDP-4-amino-4,6-dideoxygalactose transaminase
MDPDDLDRTMKLITGSRPVLRGHPKAIIPVHLYGNPADMAAILDIASAYDLAIVEDCAQAHGAEINGKKVGSFGHLSAFSFYPTKNLGGLGDGGMVLTDNEKLQQRTISLRQYGWEKRYVSTILGINSRLDELQAAILRVKLRYLKDNNRRRIHIAEKYGRLLNGTFFQLPCKIINKTRLVYHQYVIKTQDRDQVKLYLNNNGVGSAIHYPVPVHLQSAFVKPITISPNGLPNTERICREILSLPIYPELQDEQVDRICNVLNLYQR